MMRHGDVNRVDIGTREQRTVVGIEVTHCRHLAEPIERRGMDVAHRDELGPHRTIQQREPAAKGTGDFSAHEAGANDRDAHRLSRSSDR